MEPEQIQGEPALQVQQGAEQDQQKGEGGREASGKDANPAPGQKQPPGSPQGKQEAAASSPASLPARAGMVQKPMLYISASPSGKTTGHGEETSS